MNIIFIQIKLVEMLTVDEVVQALNISRDRFAHVFLQAQYELDTDARKEFKPFALSPDDKESFRVALNYASQKGFLNAFVKLVMNRGFDDGALLKLLHQKDPTNSTLQAIMNALAGFGQPAIFATNFPKAMRWTGKVLINGQFQGSGVLIGPTRFLTAWHVVRPMFELVNDNGKLTYQPLLQAPLLEVVFDDFTDFVDDRATPSQPHKVQADTDWHEMHCICHEEELNGNVNAPYSKLDGFWDYAVIRLKQIPEIPGSERRYTVLKKNAVVPVTDAKITIFQHPAAASLLYDTDKVVDLAPPDPDIPRLRFVHAVNAAPGSSGGPCFDKEFALIGLHQGTWMIDGKKFNIGIPIVNIINHIDEVIKQKGTPSKEVLDDYFICSIDTDDYMPVIGCDDFQEIILEMELVQATAALAEAGGTTEQKKTIAIISGDKGTGKTYMIDVLSALLDNSDHLKIILKGDAIAKKDAESLAKLICSIAGTDLKELISFTDYNSTAAAWIKDELVKKLVDSLDVNRLNRVVWICITDLNKFEVEGPNAADLLLHLYGYAKEKNWLRIVLDGISIEMPKTLNDVISSYTAKKITQQDVTDYITRFLKKIKQVRAKPEIIAYSGYLYSVYDKAFTADKETAVAKLSSEAQDFFDQLMVKIRV